MHKRWMCAHPIPSHLFQWSFWTLEVLAEEFVKVPQSSTNIVKLWGRVRFKLCCFFLCNIWVGDKNVAATSSFRWDGSLALSNVARGAKTMTRATRLRTDILLLKHDSRILGQSSNSVCGFSMMEQVMLCAVWPAENWLGSSINHIQGMMTV